MPVIDNACRKAIITTLFSLMRSSLSLDIRQLSIDTLRAISYAHSCTSSMCNQAIKRSRNHNIAHTFTCKLNRVPTSGQPHLLCLPLSLPPPSLPLSLSPPYRLHVTFLFCRTRGGHLLHQQCVLCKCLPRPRPCRLQLKQITHTQCGTT